MDYNILKTLHFLGILLFFVFITILFLAPPQNKNIHRGLAGFTVFIIFFTGFFLMGEIGLDVYDFWPLWVKLKIIFSAVTFALAFYLSKKLKILRKTSLYFLLILGTILFYLAVYRPPTFDFTI